MSRKSLAHAAVLTLSTCLAFFVHACTGGRPVKESMRVGEVAAAPTLQVGLGRCLRDPSVRIAVHGPWSLGGIVRGDELPWTEVRSSGEGVIEVVGKLVCKRTPLTLTAEVDGTIEVEYTRDARGNAVKPTAVRYAGSLTFHSLPGGKLAVVNEVDLEEYLKGVVGKEMNLSEGVEALKTQVIAARTYAIHEQRLDRLRRVKGEKFDLYDDERSQVYGGKERATDLASKLVDETRGMFLVYEGRLVRTFYSSACGGYTEPAWEVLSDESDKIPPLGGRRCDYCQRRPIHRWKEPVIVSKKEIAEKCLPRELQAARVRSVEITKTLPGGHAQEVTVRLENSSRVIRLHAANEFRRPISARMRSTLWDKIEDRGDSIAIYGRGFGHGAGMCQVGAYEMAKDGKTASEILEYYFPSAKVQKLY